MRKLRKYLLSAWEPITPTQYNNNTANYLMTNKEFSTMAGVKKEKNRLRILVPNVQFYLIEHTTKIWSD